MTPKVFRAGSAPHFSQADPEKTNGDTLTPEERAKRQRTAFVLQEIMHLAAQADNLESGALVARLQELPPGPSGFSSTESAMNDANATIATGANP